MEKETGFKSNEVEEGKETKEHEQDRFNLEKLRLSQKFEDLAGVKKEILMVPIRRPNNQDFFRLKPGNENRLETYLLQLKEEREVYLVSPTLWVDLAPEIKPFILHTTINRQGVLTLWPIKLPDADGRHNSWAASEFEIAKRAETQWVRMVSNKSLGAYECIQASAGLPEPIWPEIDLQRIVEIAFRDFIIETFDHPVVRRLRGL